MVTKQCVVGTPVSISHMLGSGDDDSLRPRSWRVGWRVTYMYDEGMFKDG